MTSSQYFETIPLSGKYPEMLCLLVSYDSQKLVALCSAMFIFNMTKSQQIFYLRLKR
jgi:hypothetical protein